ncbi:MAG: histidine phosphatase family protein [Planctomycetales bacterium]|nr:histidine phosphatase family protein [Planctomycetales bacterium]
MSRRLIIMRHAKSSWANPSMTDHARPLNDRGNEEAPRVAEQLITLGWPPDFILSSDAERTRQTLARMNAVWGNKIAVEYLRSLYLAGYSELTAAAQLIPETAHTVMCLGHNPGWEEVVEELSGQFVVMKTAMAALLDGPDLPWPDAIRQRGEWQLTDVVRGKH